MMNDKSTAVQKNSNNCCCCIKELKAPE